MEEQSTRGAVSDGRTTLGRADLSGWQGIDSFRAMALLYSEKVT
jgi:hypothetical protein